MDMYKLMSALDNDENENMMGLSTTKILERNLNILKALHLDHQNTLIYLKKLNGYIYIDEINELKHGSFIKWIPITDPTYIPLHYCGIICEIKIIDDGVLIKCKNFMHRHYTFKMDECLIFQKLTAQERVIINALDHLEKIQKEQEEEEQEQEEEEQEQEQEQEQDEEDEDEDEDEEEDEDEDEDEDE